MPQNSGTKRKRKSSEDSDDNFIDDGVDRDLDLDEKRGPKRKAGPNGPPVAGMYPRVHSRVQHTLTASFVKPLRDSLLAWYKEEHAKRGMPWRRPFHEPLPTDPTTRAQNAYQVWISEIMCQQTQVATVIPYFNRWMERFPTINALAASDIDAVNSVWKGLGYYSRAARLLSGAQKVVKDFDGRLPEDPVILEKEVPGIGRYSSGAIASVAYGVRAPVLDGNVNRLLSRLLALHASSKSKATLDILWGAAEAFVDDEDCKFPGDVNQALIELGSTVCKVKDPQCQTCPLSAGCFAFKETKDKSLSQIEDIEDLCTICLPHVHPNSTGVVRYPMKVEKKKAREETDLVLALEWRSVKEDSSEVERWFLLEKRPDEGLLGGLWNFPNVPCIDAGLSDKEEIQLIPDLLSDVLVSPPSMDLTKVPRKKSKALAPPTSSSTTPAKGLSKFFTPKPAQAEIVGPNSEDAGGKAGLRATNLHRPASVLHIFSHIRKTYKPVHILLEGGMAPPELKIRTAQPASGSPKKVKQTKKTKKRKKDASNSDSDTDDVVEETQRNGKTTLKWVRAEQVSDANIGTGVAKVWAKIQSG